MLMQPATLHPNAALDLQVAALAQRHEVPPPAIRLDVVQVVDGQDPPAGLHERAHRRGPLRCASRDWPTEECWFLPFAHRRTPAQRSGVSTLLVAGRPLAAPRVRVLAAHAPVASDRTN